MIDKDPHSVTQSLAIVFKKYGLIKTAIAVARAYWPALTVVVTAIVCGTISVMKIDEVLTGYKVQATLNQHFATNIARLDNRLDLSLAAIDKKVDTVAGKVDAVATIANETASKVHGLFDDQRVTVVIAPKPPVSSPQTPQKKKRS